MASGLASPSARSRRSSLTSIHQRLLAQTKSIRDSFVTCAPGRFLSYDSFTTNPGSQYPSHRAGGSLTSDRESGKDLKKLDSCRPISLTSIIGKIMGRLMKNRIRYEAEIHRHLSENRAAFRNGRSTEYKLLRLSQSISDGFQCGQIKRTALTIIDYSRA